MENSVWFQRYTAQCVTKDVTYNGIHNQNSYIHAGNKYSLALYGLMTPLGVIIDSTYSRHHKINSVKSALERLNQV